MAEPGGVIVFAGPTLYGVRNLAPIFERRGPARRGDLYQASLSRPRAIVLIDGYFDQTPSVWHKEILATIAARTPVFGVASLGALRAVELTGFGMRGFGRVFESFASGTLEDDDEVAVVHAAADDGYRPLSVAMIDIRATLAAAEAVGVIGADARSALIALGKRLHFPERSYPRLLADSAGLIKSDEIGRLEGWLPGNAVSQKRDDAVALLAAIERGAIELIPPPVSFVLQRTQIWEVLRGRLDLEWSQDVAGGQAPAREDDVGETTWRGALLRAVAREDAEQRRAAIDQALLDKFVDGFRRERGLVTAEAFERWLSSAGLKTDAAIVDFFTSELLVRSLRARLTPRARAELGHERRASVGAASATRSSGGGLADPGVDE
jgi:hypothetical protein